MGLFNFFTRRPEQRAITTDTIPALVATPTAAGVPVTVRSAMSIPSVFAAVSSVADAVSTLPLPILKRGDVQGGEKDYDHPVYDLLNRRPNPVQTARAWRSSMVVDLLTEGEHFSEIETTVDGQPVAVWRIEPSRIRTEWGTALNAYGRPTSELRYSVDDRPIPSQNLLHVVWFSLDGIRGCSPFHLCRDSLSLTLALQTFGASFFRNSARPGGFLTLAPGLSPEDKEVARQVWQDAHSGPDKVGKTAVMPPGTEYSQLTIPPEEAQYNESRINQMRECQRITRTPPHLSNDFERQTWSNIQYARMDYVQNTIRPIVVSIEQELNRKLLTDAEQQTYYVEHVVEGLLRGSFSEQIATLTQACGGPIYTRNEARKILGLPAVEGGDVLVPNTQPTPEANAPDRQLGA